MNQLTLESWEPDQSIYLLFEGNETTKWTLRKNAKTNQWHVYNCQGRLWPFGYSDFNEACDSLVALYQRHIAEIERDGEELMRGRIEAAGF